MVLKLLEDGDRFARNRNSDDVVLRAEKVILRDLQAIRRDRRISTPAVSCVFLRSDE